MKYPTMSQKPPELPFLGLPEKSVHYLWLCSRHTAEGNYATRLPLHNFERVYENAKLYPNVSFNLWLDFDQLGLKDRFFLDSHRYVFDALHIDIRNLRDIPEYQNAEGFDLDRKTPMYAKADCARVLILNHEVKAMSPDRHDQTIIYSDLDCENIYANDDLLHETLDAHGLAYARSGRHCVCNSYIAIKGQKGKAFVETELLPKTLKAFEKQKANHFGAFVEAVRHFRDAHFPQTRLPHLGIVETPPMRSSMPYNDAFYKTICAPLPARKPSDLSYI